MAGDPVEHWTDRTTTSLSTLTNTPDSLTMSSKEIAELTGKLHAHVLRDIRNMLDDLGEAESKFGSSYKDTTGRTLPMYSLPKDLTITLVAGYSVVMRHRIVTRWQELEAQVPALPNFGNPAEAARAWALMHRHRGTSPGTTAGTSLTGAPSGAKPRL